MLYNLKEHGDLLEKTYSEFIITYFPTYEQVWQLYIGNNGFDMKADIPGLETKMEEKRQSFSEHTYTVLQSVILMHRLIENKVFDKINNDELNAKLDLQNNMMLFFSHIGRIRDNVTAAAKCLNFKDVNKIGEQFAEFYHKRHVQVHGRIIPIKFNSDGSIEMPVLSKNGGDRAGWDHKSNEWSDILKLDTEAVTSTVNELFSKLLPLLTDVFGKFKKIIQMELSSNQLAIEFKYSPYQQGVSGYKQGLSMGIYGVIDPQKGYSTTDGKDGSSSYFKPEH